MAGRMLLLVVCLVAQGMAQDDEVDLSPSTIDFLSTDWEARSTGNYELDYKSFWIEAARMVEMDPVMKADAENRLKTDTRDWDYPFPPFACDSVPASNPKPTSVHALRAADIDVVAAMGDSITAGFGVGADDFGEVGEQNRGESWSVGGNDDLEKGAITLPNILRKYNADVKGYSRCRSGTSDFEYSWMNRAVGGATSRSMRGQAEDVVAKAQNDSRIDFNGDWKMVTLWVGGNDLCASCRRPEWYDPIPYREQIEDGLDYLHANLPRAIVNVIVMFDVTPLPELSTGPFCDALHWGICSCCKNETTRLVLRQTQMNYYYELSNLIECSAKYDTTDDFSVVLQPMMRDILPPIDPDTGEYDPSFLSYDCFHPARKAHQMFAHLLWDTMWIPVGEKPFTVDINDPNMQYFCPDDNHFIATNLNSQPGWKAPVGALREDPLPVAAGGAAYHGNSLVTSFLTICFVACSLVRF